MDLSSILVVIGVLILMALLVFFYLVKTWIFKIWLGMRVGEWMEFREILKLGVPLRYTLAILVLFQQRKIVSVKIRSGLLDDLRSAANETGISIDAKFFEAMTALSHEPIPEGTWLHFPNEFEFMLHSGPRRRKRRKKLAKAPVEKDLVPATI